MIESTAVGMCEKMAVGRASGKRVLGSSNTSSVVLDHFSEPPTQPMTFGKRPRHRIVASVTARKDTASHAQQPDA